MSDGGFEALADGTLLLAILLVASCLVALQAAPPSADLRSEGLRYAEDTRLALFRTTMDGLEYAANGTAILLPNGTSVESFLRIEAYVLHVRGGPADFSAANARVAALAARLLRPDWRFAITAKIEGEARAASIPESTDLPGTYFESGWTYPSLDGTRAGTRLSLALWLNRPR